MADPAQDALLYRPGIRAGAKLLEIVIGFDDKDVASAEMVAHAAWHIAQVGGEAYLDSLCPKREPDRISGVVRNSKGLDFNITNLEASAGGKTFALRQCGNLALFVAHGPAPFAVSGFSQKNWHVQFGSEPMQSGNMVGMLVRNQDGGQVFGTLTQHTQTL